MVRGGSAQLPIRLIFLKVGLYGVFINMHNKRPLILNSSFNFDGAPHKTRVAVILHLHHVDLREEIVSYLQRIPEVFDLYITLTDESALALVHDYFVKKVPFVRVSLVENRGRDVRPFFKVLKEVINRKYVCILKIHSKKSGYSQKVDQWRSQIFDGVLPNAIRIASIINGFAVNSHLEMVAPKESYLSNEMYWGGNKNSLENLLFQNCIEDSKLFFIGGTMFWFAPNALNTLVEAVDLNLFEAEGGQRDGTFAHVLERAFCLFAMADGYYCATTINMACPLAEEDVVNNRVLVL